MVFVSEGIQSKMFVGFCFAQRPFFTHSHCIFGSRAICKVITAEAMWDPVPTLVYFGVVTVFKVTNSRYI
jgi:hypothetical protein